jgi:hypothetical protein
MNYVKTYNQEGLNEIEEALNLNDVLKPWIYENHESAKLANELTYMWNTMEASGMATISDKYNELEKIVLSFTNEYYKGSGAYEIALLPKEILLTVWEHFGLDPYAKH